MKINDLASMVSIRNHIYTVLNDKSVTSRDEFPALNQARIKIDKKFVSVIINEIDTILADSDELAMSLVNGDESSVSSSSKDQTEFSFTEQKSKARKTKNDSKG